MTARGRLRFPAVLVVLAAAILAGAGASAHFRLNTNIRVIHVERAPGAIRVFMRLPTPLALARWTKGVAQPLDEARRYIVTRSEGGRTVHFLNPGALRADPLGLGRIIASAHTLSVDGKVLNGEVKAVRVHPASVQPRFATLAEAKRALEGEVYPAGLPPALVGDTVTDVVLCYRTADSAAPLSLASRLGQGLGPGADIANVIVDHVAGKRRIYRTSGLLVEPVILDSTPLSAAMSFVRHGVRHILEGLDHVLFVLCLTVGASTVTSLLWRVTGFSAGHTLTLIAGFLGYAPSAPWFIPAVEVAIALSIIYAAVVALLGRSGAATFFITAAIGLLHGFGFSFVLRDMLALDAPNLIVSLVSFNVGVEIGQAGIVLAVWPALHLLSRGWPSRGRQAGSAIAIACLAIAALLSGERVMRLVESLLA